MPEAGVVIVVVVGGGLLKVIVALPVIGRNQAFPAYPIDMAPLQVMLGECKTAVATVVLLMPPGPSRIVLLQVG